MPKKLKHCFGMAVHGDRDGALFTFQTIIAHFPKLMPVSEIVVVCQDPDSRHGKLLEADCKSASKGASNGGCEVRFIPMPEPIGACPPKQRVFHESRAKYTTVFDAHVVPQEGSLYGLDKYYDEHPDCNDLLTGPLVYSDRTISTHWDDMWGGPMRGVWSEAWERPDGTNCSVVRGKDGMVRYCELAAGSKPMDGPAVKFSDRKVVLPTHGYRKLGHTPGEAFEIPCQGEFVFSCRTEAWPGLNPQFRGFTGQAWYINEKFKRRGFKTICLADLKTWHRFGNVYPTTYPNTYSDRARNYAIGLRELGLPLDDLRRAYVEGPKQLLTAEVFDRIAADPISYPPSKPRVLGNPDGFGTELLKLVSENGITAPPECPCRRAAATFNAWGVDVCEARREEIITGLRKNAKAWGWIFKIEENQQQVDEAMMSEELADALEPRESDDPVEPATLGEKLKVGVLAVATGTIFKVDKRDPFPGLVDEALRRAKAKIAARKAEEESAA